MKFRRRTVSEKLQTTMKHLLSDYEQAVFRKDIRNIRRLRKYIQGYFTKITKQELEIDSFISSWLITATYVHRQGDIVLGLKDDLV